MMNRSLVKVATACALALTLASCAASRVDANFGDAVQSTVDGQIYDPVAANSPSPDAVTGTDGQRMEAVMESHRGQSGNGANVGQPIEIGVGQ